MSAKVWLYKWITIIITKKKIKISFLRIKQSFICKKLTAIHTRIPCAKFVWKWSCGSRGEYRQCIFVILSTIQPGKVHGLSFKQKMFCAIFDWNWFSEEDKNMKQRWTGEYKSSLEFSDEIS